MTMTYFFYLLISTEFVRHTLDVDVLILDIQLLALETNKL